MEKENKPAEFSVVSTAVLFVATVTLLVLAGGLLWWYWENDLSTEWNVLRQIMTACFVVWVASLCVLVLGFIAFHLVIRDNVMGDASSRPVKKKSPSRLPLKADIASYLRQRYTFFWRQKVRLLLVTGDEAVIERLAPGLQQQQWLEGNRTVLIYGGSLALERDSDKYTALRKLRRGRPLDGIVRMLAEGQDLTPQMSDSDLRGLEKIGEALRYSAPVYLWQLCGSNWPQAGRKSQPIGVTFPPRAAPENVAAQLNALLPQLREQGLSQVAENRSYDFLLRLAQQFEQGESERWKTRLAPWLYGSQQQVPLRGLMFSLNGEDEPAIEAVGIDARRAHLHALTLPVTWQGIVDDCTRVRGRRVGMAWEQALVWALLGIIGVWGTGLLLSFALNYSQITSVAGKARVLVEHPAISDSQLTGLHDLRNEAGRLQQQVEDGAPWYQRFGLGHHAQLLNAMLPWYGVANNRLIRNPVSSA